jgi:hypothetical protein
MARKDKETEPEEEKSLPDTGKAGYRKRGCTRAEREARE